MHGEQGDLPPMECSPSIPFAGNSTLLFGSWNSCAFSLPALLHPGTKLTCLDLAIFCSQNFIVNTQLIGHNTQAHWNFSIYFGGMEAACPLQINDRTEVRGVHLSRTCAYKNANKSSIYL